MLSIYTATPNGQKISIALEELKLKYDAHTVHIGRNEQHQPWFLQISPNNRIPALVDRNGPDNKPIKLFESASILIYLAEKTGSTLLPKSGANRYNALQWMMWSTSGLSPMCGQLNHFYNYSPQPYWTNFAHCNKDLSDRDLWYARKRFLNEVRRLFGVLEQQLKSTGEKYVAGSNYSLADISIWPWTNAVLSSEQPQIAKAFQEFTYVQQWTKHVGERPAVLQGKNVNSLM